MLRLQVSDNRRFLVTEDGAPFFWLGDTAWELFHRCTREEAEHYLENRRQKGFTVVQAVVLAELDGLRAPNPYGHVPLIAEDPAHPNEAYFQHVDYIVDLAATKGIYIGMLPTWGDKVNLQWGKGPVIFNESTARAYGAFIGSRYRDHKNIVWILGGDRDEITDGVDYAPVWRAMAAGIQAGASGNPLMTYHPRGGRGSSITFHQDDWLSFNMWQSGHGMHDAPNWEMIAQDYALTPVKPVLDGEPCYEDHPVNPYTRQWQPEHGYFIDYDVRKQAYRAVFAGAFGHTYGNHCIWQMYLPGREPMALPLSSWKAALDRPGASQLIHLRRLMESRPFLTRVPDQRLLASEPGEGMAHVQATCDAEGRYAMVHIPNAKQTVEIDMSRLSGGQLVAQWYDPREGTAIEIGAFTNRGVQPFTTPAAGRDWVLVLDDRAMAFPPPGAHRGR